MDGRKLNGYRHEFGSLLEAMADAKINSHPEADLILHLIAVHHGWARPHFLSSAWDIERHTDAQNEQAVLETMRRFGRLQQRFGRWGLAWLECLIRCTDVLASHQIEVPSDTSTAKEVTA
jgi:CRISPR-associated endonuclease/helicase Cas3